MEPNQGPVRNAPTHFTGWRDIPHNQLGSVVIPVFLTNFGGEIVHYLHLCPSVSLIAECVLSVLPTVPQFLQMTE